MASDFVNIRRAHVLSALRDLECIVVSLDHLGSSHVDMPNGESERAVDDFINRWNVFKKLNHLRLALGDAYCTSYGRGGEDFLERHLEKVPKWTMKHRDPPRRAK